MGRGPISNLGSIQHGKQETVVLNGTKMGANELEVEVGPGTRLRLHGSTSCTRNLPARRGIAQFISSCESQSVGSANNAHVTRTDVALGTQQAFH